MPKSDNYKTECSRLRPLLWKLTKKFYENSEKTNKGRVKNDQAGA